jgi:hypothetical protein
LKFSNPFYSLLLAAGIAFAVTAAAYCIMMLQEARADALAANAPVVESTAAIQHPLLAWLSEYGDAALIGELVVLGVCVFAAIGTDDFWQRRAARNQNRRSPG